MVIQFAFSILKLRNSKRDFQRLVRDHTREHSPSRQEKLLSSTNLKMQDVHTVPWGFCRREHMDATWLNFPYKMVLVKLLKCSLLVRLSNFFITVASSWFSKVINKDASCFVNRGFVWLFADQNLKRSSIFEQQNERFKTFQCRTVSSPATSFRILPLVSHTDGNVFYFKMWDKALK